jgi:hypothetical protein
MKQQTLSASDDAACSHGPDCGRGGPGKPHEGDPQRPCSACGEIIGHGAHQHICDECGEECCTACSVDGPKNTVLCDECDPANAIGEATPPEPR